MAARKPWSALSPDYKRRMQANGLTARNWNTKRGDALRQAARGHGETPERPSQAAKHPAKYGAYNQRKADLLAAVRARKTALWGDRLHYKQGRSDKAVTANPVDGDYKGTTVDAALARKFLKMTDGEAEEMASRVGLLVQQKRHELDSWAFMFYH